MRKFLNLSPMAVAAIFTFTLVACGGGGGGPTAPPPFEEPPPEPIPTQNDVIGKKPTRLGQVACGTEITTQTLLDLVAEYELMEPEAYVQTRYQDQNRNEVCVGGGKPIEKGIGAASYQGGCSTPTTIHYVVYSLESPDTLTIYDQDVIKCRMTVKPFGS